MEALMNMLCYIKGLLSERQFAKKYTVEGKKISKHKNLDFLNTCLFVLCRKNPVLGFELLEYKNKYGKEIAKRSITVARQKVTFESFRHILKEISHLFPILKNIMDFSFWL